MKPYISTVLKGGQNPQLSHWQGTRSAKSINPDEIGTAMVINFTLSGGFSPIISLAAANPILI